MNSKIGRWMAVDPLFRKYPELSPYNFVADNPLNAIDPDGRKILFVNGYYNTGWLSGLAGSVGLKDYWGEKFVKSAGMYLENTEKFKREFIDGRGKWNSTGEERFDAGYEYAKANYASITNGIFDAKGVQIETIKVVSHSMGGAYSEGMIKYLEEKGVNVEKVVHLSPADPSGFTASPNPMTLQINLEFDIVLGYKNFFEVDKIEGVDAYGDVKTEKNVIVDLFQSHMATKCEGCGAMLGMSGAVFEWGMVKDLESINFEKKGNTFATPYGTITGSSNVYNAVGNANNTQFNRVYTRSSTYTPTNKKNEYKLSNL
jgi:pimeloyl-ACP methyl ester carboxylesterase